ncbi:FAD-dependent oxidoreductase [Sphingobium sp. HWE2-09]|uniref:FAD-dependent oxidoreductase n=1 Tax=Sphingobium sp. HWE2-09 TaxID=3108390 RepID=UPI002DC65B7F|nr:FAD-dependent oxidoreductase [Sphingobium sp. HWE2-09]
MNDSFEFTVPVLVIGGGACGCIAALAAKDAGVDVLLVEADARPMGSSGMSQGLICAAGTQAQAALGVEDDAETFFADIMAKTQGQTDTVIARALAEQSGPTLDWMVERHQLPWELDTGFRPVYGNSRFRVHGWRGHGGQEMVDLLHQKLADEGVDVLLEAKLVDMVADADGRVLGVVLERPDGSHERVGCETIIFAAGGFAANHAMVAQFMPDMANARNNGHERSQGIAVRMGQRIGAALGDMGAYQGYAMLTEPQGIPVPPGVLVEGGMIVNMAGERFTDESADIAGMCHPVMAQPGTHCWVIYDAGIEERCAYIPETQALMELNAAKCGDTVAALAQAIGVDADALAQTLAQAHDAQRAGTPDRFGRDWGKDTPPSGSLRALKVVGAIFHTQGGLQIDGSARVLRPDGSALPNVFAGGGSARSVSGPSSWGYLPAMGLCTAVTLGRIAGEAAAAQVKG